MHSAASVMTPHACVRRWRCRSVESERRNCRSCQRRRMEVTMTESSPPMRTWLAAPMDRDVSEAIERLRHAPDVKQIAVMPDVHLAADVCIGVVVATSHLIYPQAVGGDIGCGMIAVGLDLEAAAVESPRVAGQVLADLRLAVPPRRRNRRALVSQPGE